MLLSETLRLSLSSLTANKLRSSLTVVGIAVGVFSVIGVMTFISGMQSMIESGLNVLGANSFQINKFPAINFSDPRRRFGNRQDITYSVAERFRELMGDDVRISIQIGRGGRRAIYRDRRTNPNVQLMGADENFIGARNYDVAAGRNLSAEDVAFGRPVCLLGSDVAKKLFPNEDGIGRLVRIESQNYRVVGLLAPKPAALGGNQDSIAITPITRWLAVYGQARRSMSINVQAPSQDELPMVLDRAIGAMRLARGLAPEDGNDFEVFSNESLIEAFNKIASVVATGAFVISAIALVAAGVGVMNIMLVSVTERTKEIGIRKSIGAKKQSILLQFLMEAVTLSLIGGLVGVAVGVAGGNAVAMVMKATISFPWTWAGIALLVCSAIGIGFGFYPAWKAASLDPIEALRYE